ncbi:phage terminase small subunit P27 family [Peribacillus frigoritolerans]|uniref:phage terminase small subunit P27 family n=1 Tax=Peribacillus frigoritolerans TaxID=450367 RepID=UPI00207AD022|nr:phage terminase small subunit P27 family [Peribacillus frigoritolerans]USK78967.1 phage terminase small subunit P27 family [Peribacillus frigoritolerans]
MAGTRKPIDLLVYSGKKHFSKAEIEERKKSEVKAPSDKVKPPSYLPKDLKKEFKKISEELVAIGIMTNLDVDSLARFVQVQKMYLDVTNNLLALSPIKTVEIEEYDIDGNVTGSKFVDVPNELYSELLTMQDKLFKQCRAASSDLGLTISSRCKLVIPKGQQEEEKPTSKEAKRFGGRL